MITTAFTELVGCQHPIQQATMGGVSGRQLAAAVANAGAVGMLHSFGPMRLPERLDWMDQNTSGVWGVGFNGLSVDENMDRFEVAVERAAIIEISFIEPRADLVDLIHQEAKLSFWQVGGVESARMAIDLGVDVVVVQGTEAGGHHVGVSALMTVLEPVIDLSEGPVLAGGGISDGRALADVLRAGADGARMGTAFVASVESDASDAYREALVAASAGDTSVTTAFGAEWPDWPHRVLTASIEAAEAIDHDPIGVYDDGTSRFDLPRFSTMAPTPYSSGPHEAMAMYAGTGVGSVQLVQTAAQVVAAVMSEAESAVADMHQETLGSSLADDE